MTMLPDNLVLHCGITELPIKKTILYGYEIGAVFEGAWQPLVISPNVFGSFKEAEVHGERAKISARKALLKRRLKNIQETSHIFRKSSHGEDNAS